MNLLVTGAAGNQGGHVVRFLLQEAPALLPSRAVEDLDAFLSE